MRHVRVTLLHSGLALLTQFDAHLAAKAMESLTASGVAVRTSVRVTEVTDTKASPHGTARHATAVMAPCAQCSDMQCPLGSMPRCSMPQP